MKQHAKKPYAGRRLLVAAMAALLALSLSGCFFFGGSDWSSTDLLKDGEYDFIEAQDTVTWLMEHAKAGDVDGIYQVFSPKAKESSGNLREKIEELIEFVNDKMISYECHTGGPAYTKSRNGKMLMQREIEFFIQTEETRYHCYLDDVIFDSFAPTNLGFNSVVVVPENLYGLCSYGNFSDDGLGVFLSYQGKSHDESTLENLWD